MMSSKETVSQTVPHQRPRGPWKKKMKNQGIVPPKHGVWARNVASAAAADVAALQLCHLRVSALRAAVPYKACEKSDR